jgi:tetratricopeptide (TPR) repeat protein
MGLDKGRSFVRPPRLTGPASQADELVVQYKNQADELRKKGQFREAIELCKKALELKPEDEDVHFNLAFIYAKTGATNEAYAHYTKVLEIFPEYVEAHNNLGNLLLAQGRLDEAIEHYRAVIAISPDNEKAHNNLGIALNHQGKTKEAAVHFTKVLRINPDYLEARFNLARVALLLQDTHTAEIQFAEMLERTNKVTAHNLVGTILAQAGDIIRAETHYAEALRLNPDSYESRYNLARAWLQLGQKDKAIAALKEVLRARPNFQPAELVLRLAEASRSPTRSIPSTNVPPSQYLPVPATNEAPSASREKVKTD